MASSVRGPRSTPTLWCALATNVLGGCRGSTGPSSLARDGRPWGSRFPQITVRDQVSADVAALAALGITEVAAVIGGSMGGARAGVDDRLPRPGTGRAGARRRRSGPPPIRSAPRPPRSPPSPPTPTGRRGLSRHRLPPRHRTPAGTTVRPPDLPAAKPNWTPRFGNSGQDDENLLSGAATPSRATWNTRAPTDPPVRRRQLRDAHRDPVQPDVGCGRGGVAAALRSCRVPAVVGGITSDRFLPAAPAAGTGRPLCRAAAA